MSAEKKVGALKRNVRPLITCLHEAMKARVLMFYVIRQTSMKSATIYDPVFGGE